MNQNEILEKARQSSKDERELHLHKQSIAIGWSAVTVIMLLLVILRSTANESSNDLLLLLMTHASVSSLYYYRKTKNIIYLMTTLMGILAMGLSAYNILFEYGLVS